MKKLVLLLVLLSVLVTIGSGCSQPAKAAGPSAAKYQDGTYEFKGQTDGEGYYVKGKLTVSAGKIESADWAIYDANRGNEIFDKDYEVVFTGNDTYIQQCRDNLKGMAEYAPKLIATQDAAQVDVVSGATWAYNKFYEFAQGALKEAEAK